MLTAAPTPAEQIDTDSANFKKGLSVGQAGEQFLERMIRNPVCETCGAKNATEAETMCRPSGDSCPGCEFPLEQLWRTPAEQAGGEVIDNTAKALRTNADDLDRMDTMPTLALHLRNAAAGLEAYAARPLHRLMGRFRHE